jgi:hypothetical protein
MGHFVKHWPAHLIEDVEDIVRLRVSPVFYVSFLCSADTNQFTIKFIKQFEELNKKSQPQATHICKTLSSSKHGRRNIDDTDTETDDDDCQQVVNTNNCWIEEWKLYLNTHEVVPDGVGIARWWGVRVLFISRLMCSQYVYFSCTEVVT